MRVLKRSPWLVSLGLMLAVSILTGSRAGADVRTDEPGSIVIFPKVIADGTRDTLIALTNTSNMERFVHCIYVNGGGTCLQNPDTQCSVDSDCPDFDTGETCEFLWTETNFGIRLTRQQPTIWRVSTGRVIDATDSIDGRCEIIEGNPDRQSCEGFDAGNVPPPVLPFRGELKCIEVDDSEIPAAMNSLKGEAIIETLGSPEIGKYNSLNIQGNPEGVDTNLALELNNTEYNACPASIEFLHYADGATDLIASGLESSACDSTGCPVRTEVTLIPCTQNFEEQAPLTVTPSILSWDQFEFPLSGGQPFTCWQNADLPDLFPIIFDADQRGSFLKTMITTTGQRCIAGPNLSAPCSDDDDCGGAANGGVCGPQPGLLAVVEEFRTHDGDPAELFGSPAAVNVHMIEGRQGICRVRDGGGNAVACTSDADCDALGGLCRDDGTPCTSDSDCSNTTTAGLNRCDFCVMDSIEVPEIVPAPANCTSSAQCLPGQTCSGGICTN